MTWILLRGLTREARHWGDFPAKLEIHTAQQVLTPDLPGSGKLFRQKSPTTVAGMLEATRLQLQLSGAKPPFDVLGLSLGGMVAAAWAQRYPDEVSSLVLVNTSMRPFSRLSQRLRPQNWAQLLNIATGWRSPAQAVRIERAIHGLTCRESGSRDAEVALWAGIRHSAPSSAANAVRQLYAAARFSCRPAPPPCPVLILSSSRDQLVDPACSLQLAAAWQARHALHAGAGHDLPHDDGHWICQQITNRLDAASSP
jgi:pimeloyl-ACP methyl ester carboxylesterase